MKKILLGIIIGWTLNIASVEFAEFQYFDLDVDALDLGLERNRDGVREIDDYIEANDYDIFDYINYRPHLWKCRFMFRDSCPIKALVREPIPVKDRPKRN